MARTMRKKYFLIALIVIIAGSLIATGIITNFYRNKGSGPVVQPPQNNSSTSTIDKDLADLGVQETPGGKVAPPTSTPDSGKKNNGGGGNQIAGYGLIYYVRTGGGTASQCTGRVNADYPGTGSNQPCAFKHPFIALPPQGTPILKGGDTLIIGNGSYMMGYGAIGAEKCQQGGSYDCVMAGIPSGPSVSAPTRILGANWNTGCAIKPELYGVERSWAIFDLTKSSNVKIECLEITDHNSCIEKSGESGCPRDAAPYGQWAAVGLYASDSNNVFLKNLNIHGLANSGIHAGRISNWRLEGVRLAANGLAGFDGDIPGGSSNSGTITFKKVKVEWNGCGETYPGGAPTDCTDESAGGYGDGLGTGATGGNWVIEDSFFTHNTQDGLDLLYHTKGGIITLKRVKAEGNAGNQIKTSGNLIMSDSLVAANCGYFDGKPFTKSVSACRAAGNALSVQLSQATDKVSLINNSLYGQGDCLVIAQRSGGGSGIVRSLNNIFLGDYQYGKGTEASCLFWSDQNSITFDNSYSVIYGVKDLDSACPAGSHNICKDPLLTSIGPAGFNLRPKNESPAVNDGLYAAGVTSIDYTGKKRPKINVDIGAYEAD
ncbi:MAG: choice-of-anchor Q domain-containing protein [Patescibacteria group bacterium]